MKRVVRKATIAPGYKYTNSNNRADELRTRSILSVIWSTIVFILNTYILFTVIYWISVGIMPSGTIIFFEVAMEVFLLIELGLRVLYLKISRRAFESLNLLHTRDQDGVFVFLLLLVSNIPLVMIYSGIHNTSSKVQSIFSRIMVLKLLRCFEILRTFERVEEILFYKKFKTLIIVKSVKNFVSLLLTAHILTCGWLLIGSTHAVDIYQGIETNEHNPYRDSTGYFERAEIHHGEYLEMYADSLSWAASTISGCSFFDVSPKNFNEVVLALVSLLIGTISLAKVFADLEQLRELSEIEHHELKEKLHHALQFCDVMNIPHEIKTKITEYYSLNRQDYLSGTYISAVKGLPKSLHTDVVLSLNKEMAGSVNLFNYATPAFVINIARYLYPKIVMEGDYVVQAGEFATEMFFIKSGEVEVLLGDGTQIAVMKSGSYFGEIGLLLTGKRTVSVRALTFSSLQCINKQDFDRLMDLYPDQKQFLMRVAKQRVKITRPEDIKVKTKKNNLEHAMMEVRETQLEDIDEASANYLKKISSLKFDQAKKVKEQQQQNKRRKLTESWSNFVNFLKQYSAKHGHTDLRNSEHFIVLPCSIFDLSWSMILMLGFSYNIFFMFFDIAFGDEYDRDSCDQHVLPVEIIIQIIYLLDIFIHSKRAIVHHNKLVTDPEEIKKAYYMEHFIVDFVAFLPLEYIMILLGLPCRFMFYIKFLKLLKFPRLYKVTIDLLNSHEVNLRFFLVIMLAIIYIVLNHIIACIMYLIAKDQYFNTHAHHSLFLHYNEDSVTEIPFEDQSPYVKYVNMMYWALMVTSSGSSGDIKGLTPIEKIFQALCLLLFRIYFSFVEAEAARTVTSIYMSVAEGLEKKKMYEHWMMHIQLPTELMNRVRKYNEFSLTKSHGLDQNSILKDLPESIRDSIIENLVKELITKVGIFPASEVGLTTNLAKKFYFIMINKDEYVFRSGETAEEMFFLLEGVVAIKNDNNEEIAVLQKNNYFGEMAIMGGKTGVHSVK